MSVSVRALTFLARAHTYMGFLLKNANFGFRNFLLEKIISV